MQKYQLKAEPTNFRYVIQAVADVDDAAELAAKKAPLCSAVKIAPTALRFCLYNQLQRFRS